MATVTHGISTPSTANASTYTSGSFTPAASDLLVVFVNVTDSALASPTMTDSQGLGFTKILGPIARTGGHNLYLFIALALAAAAAMTVTFDCTGDAGSGCDIEVARVSGMTRTGSSASRQTASQASQAAGGTPAPTFGSACLTENPTLGAVGNNSNPATLTPPTLWTEQDDTGHATPTCGTEYVSRDSGFTGTTITWGSTSATAFGDIAVELDTSAAPSGTPPTRTLMGVGT